MPRGNEREQCHWCILSPHPSGENLQVGKNNMTGRVTASLGLGQAYSFK